LKKTIINTEEIIHPIFYMAFVALFNYGLFQLISIKYLALRLFFFLASYKILSSFLNISNVVLINKKEIKKGLYISTFGFVKIKEHIDLKEVKEVILSQNTQLRYDIILTSKTNKQVILKTLANKNPAVEELSKIKSILSNFQSNIKIP
jgi:hypothetical protein